MTPEQILLAYIAAILTLRIFGPLVWLGVKALSQNFGEGGQ